MAPVAITATVVGASFTYFINKIDKLLTEEAYLLAGVHQDMNALRRELAGMLAFLEQAQSANEMPREDANVRMLVRQVRELAYDLEDCIDLYAYCFGKVPQRKGMAGFLLRQLFLLRTIKQRHHIARLAQDTIALTSQVQEKIPRYSLPTGSRSDHEAGPNRRCLLFNADSELVGVDEARGELTRWLTVGEENTDLDLLVMSVVGMPGSGKTSLAWKLYADPTVRSSFQCHAWITVSHFRLSNINRLLRGLLARLRQNSQQLRDMETDELVMAIRDYLRVSTYLIVIDDLQPNEMWEQIKQVFPVGDECRGPSRIIVTTQSNQVAGSCHVSLDVRCRTCKLDPLSPRHAWTLFCRTTYHSSASNCCPEHLKDISEKIVNMCCGLPVAIKAVSGVLAKKLHHTRAEWQKVYDALNSEDSSADILTQAEKILNFSYNNLPYNLSLCFLCFGVYPSVKSSRLFRIWIAEGFAMEEEEARGYLNELIDRNLVNVTETDILGRAKCCSVNSVIRPMIVRICREENFATSFVQLQRRLPSQIVRLGCLRHLFLPIPPFTNTELPLKCPLDVHWSRHADSPGVKLPAGIGGLGQLEKLAVADASGDEVMRELGALTKLRKLGVRGIKEGDCSELCAAIPNMPCLASLALLTAGKEENLRLDSLPHDATLRLERLLLAGRLDDTHARWLSSLTCIIKIVLVGSRLTEDVLAALQDLPDLMYLSLVDAYAGARLSAGCGKFPKLKMLRLSRLSELESVALAAGATPRLEELSILHCPKLKQNPWSRDTHPQLEVFHVHNCAACEPDGLDADAGEGTSGTSIEPPH